MAMSKKFTVTVKESATSMTFAPGLTAKEAARKVYDVLKEEKVFQIKIDPTRKK